jgi:orotate phosphoribosyltransferase
VRNPREAKFRLLVESIAMVEEILPLMAARHGHFLLESGHHGELWLDVDRLFVNPAALRPFARLLADRLAPHCVEALCGPLTGGAFLAQLVAEELGVPWAYANREVPRQPAGLFPVAYPIPHELVEFIRNRRVAVVNDVINAGSAVRGALASLRAAGATAMAIASLLTLGEAPAKLAADAGIPLESLAHAPNRIWAPADCPLCMAAVPLVAPA